MRAFLALLLLAFAIQSSHAQEVTRAIFESCRNAEAPYECSDEKLESDVEKIIGEKLSREIRKSADSAHFTVDIAFLSDGKGAVIPETVKVECKVLPVTTAIKEYLITLPPFYPKNTDEDELRTAHIEEYTFVFNDETRSYNIASSDELKTLGIKPVDVMLATPPLFQDCTEKSDPNDCTVKKIYKLVQNSFIVPDFTGPNRSINLVASYVIEKDGRLNITEVTCSEENPAMIDEYKRVLNSLPAFIPAHYLGVMVRVSYKLPMTVTLAN